MAKSSDSRIAVLENQMQNQIAAEERNSAAIRELTNSINALNMTMNSFINQAKGAQMLARVLWAIPAMAVGAFITIITRKFFG